MKLLHLKLHHMKLSQSKKAIAVFSLLGLITLLTGCTATKLTDTWRSDSFDKSDFDKVLVIALTSNITNRMLFENEFARVYERHGINSSVSYKILGSEFPTRELVEAHLKDTDAKYVLVTKFGGVSQEKDYVPPKAVVYSTGYGGYYNGPYYGSYYDNWGGSSVLLTREGYTDVHTNVMLVTSVYRVSDEELVWVGKTTTTHGDAVSDVAKRLAEKLATAVH